MFPRFCILLLLATVLVPPHLAAAPQTDVPWNNLSRLTHHASFIFVDVERNCAVGSVQQLTDSFVVVKRKDGKVLTIQRPDLMRVTYGANARGVLFSGRSSWFDIVSLISQPFHPELRVETASGHEHKGTLVVTSDTALVLQTGQRKIDLRKEDIARVTYIIAKPLSSSAAYADDELAFMKVFDPELWPKLLGLQGSLSVRLFDASFPQDNSPVVCKNNPWGLNQPPPDVTRP